MVLNYPTASSFWGSTQISSAIVILNSLKKIKRPHLLPSAWSRAAYLPSAVLRSCLIWELANLSFISTSKIVPGTCTTRKYLFLCVFVHFLVSFTWWRKIKYCVSNNELRLSAERFKFFSMTQELEEAQGSQGNYLDLYLTQNNVYFFVRSVSWQGTAKSIFLLWLLWLWRGHEFCYWCLP